MKRTVLGGVALLALAMTLTGCNNVHFTKNNIEIGQQKKKQAAHSSSSVKKVVKSASSKISKSNKVKPKKINKTSKPKKAKRAKPEKKSLWDHKKTTQLAQATNNWSKAAGQTYKFYDGKHPLHTKIGATYPAIFKQQQFMIDGKQRVKLGYSPNGKNKFAYNVVAIGNDNFANWHNTYLFCLHHQKAVILLDQGKIHAPMPVKTVHDQKLQQIFNKLVHTK